MKSIFKDKYSYLDRIVIVSVKILQTEEYAIHRKYNESAQISLVDQKIIQPISQQSENYNSVQCRLCVKMVFTATIQGISLFHNDSYSEENLLFINSHEIAYGHVC
jgi:hypothetical protein